MKSTCGFVIAAFLVAAASAATPVEKCADGPLPNEVRVEGCTETPCTLIRGQDVNAEWDFTVDEDTKALKPRVRASLSGGLTVPYQFPQKNACESLVDSTCPLDGGEDVTYKLTMPIQKNYPRLSLTIEFAFLNDYDKVVVCFKLPVKIADE